MRSLKLDITIIVVMVMMTSLMPIGQTPANQTQRYCATLKPNTPSVQNNLLTISF
jgi:hypothetical protein